MDSRYLQPLVAISVVLVLAQLRASASDGGVQYDHFATTECLQKPPSPSYGGGIIVNPDINDGLQGWTPFGNTTLEVRSAPDGNNYLVAQGRKNSYDAPSQNPNLTQGMMYTLAAWLQISGINTKSAVVKATVATHYSNGGAGTEYNCAGTVIARAGCWSLLKGGLTLDSSPSSATLYFESNDTEIEIWLDSVSLQPFSPEQWQAHQEANIQQSRKGHFIVHVVNSTGHPLKGAKLFIKQTRQDIPIGCAIANTILNNSVYQKWFLERFHVATFLNELKWYSTEPEQGQENYRNADAMVSFCKANNIKMRGHNIVWEDPKYVMQWVKNLNAQQLQQAVDNRVHSVVGRYKGQFIQWDVSNEMLHFSFFEDKLGPNASANIFQLVQQLDPSTPLFMNDYNTIETCSDMASIPDAYVQKLHDISRPGLIEGIGLESHFSKPNLPLMRSVLDKLGSLGLPTWLTEVDIDNNVNQTTQAEYLEQVLREGFSHPAVGGIVIWSAWPHPSGCDRMCLIDNNFNNLPPGDTVDKLLKEWQSTGISGFTDHESGTLKFSGFYGEYTVTVKHPHITRTNSFKISRTSEQPQHISVVV
eukprot:PITA_30791